MLHCYKIILLSNFFEITILPTVDILNLTIQQLKWIISSIDMFYYNTHGTNILQIYIYIGPSIKYQQHKIYKAQNIYFCYKI